MEQNSHMKKEKEMKTTLKAKVYARCFYFIQQDAIECMVRFRIYSYTVKRGILKQNSYLVPLGLN